MEDANLVGNSHASPIPYRLARADDFPELPSNEVQVRGLFRVRKRPFR